MLHFGGFCWDWPKNSTPYRCENKLASADFTSYVDSVCVCVFIFSFGLLVTSKHVDIFHLLTPSVLLSKGDRKCSEAIIIYVDF